ncbi:MAG: hypothetical protein RLZZ347_245 [Candidatus Parcubacteria bacterium]|jgi:hypothetical protein
MKTLLFVVVPDANASFGTNDGGVLRSLRSMFEEQILGLCEIAVACYGGELAQKYAMILPFEPAKFLYVIPNEVVGHFGSTLTQLCQQFQGNEHMLCVTPANIFSVKVAQGLVKANFGVDITDFTLRLMEATTHGAFLFTDDRKVVPVLVTFPPSLPA